jgi:hypothetical protein
VRPAICLHLKTSLCRLRELVGVRCLETLGNMEKERKRRCARMTQRATGSSGWHAFAQLVLADEIISRCFCRCRRPRVANGSQSLSLARAVWLPQPTPFPFEPTRARVCGSGWCRQGKEATTILAQGAVCYPCVRNGPYVIGRGDKIRTCDPLHPMDSRAKRDATGCHGLHRLTKLTMPYFIGFQTFCISRVVSQRSDAYPPQSVPKVYLKLRFSPLCPDPLSGSPAQRSKSAV